MQNITAIIVSYNTPDLLRNAIASVRRFYPTLPVIIIDGSPPDSECWMHALSLQDQNTTVKAVEYNIGHGKGLHMGMGMAATEFALFMDSDVEIIRGNVLEDMMGLLNSNQNILNGSWDGKGRMYGIGQIIEVNEHGGNQSGTGFFYLHPHFALISKEEYFKSSPAINHGAPMLKAMRDKGFNSLISSFEVGYYITHHERGTRKQNPKEFNPANWDKV